MIMILTYVFESIEIAFFFVIIFEFFFYFHEKSQTHFVVFIERIQKTTWKFDSLKKMKIKNSVVIYANLILIEQKYYVQKTWRIVLNIVQRKNHYSQSCCHLRHRSKKNQFYSFELFSFFSCDAIESTFLKF